MGEHPDSTVVRKGYEAFNRGDMQMLGSLLTSDCTHHAPGTNDLAGHHKGRDACLDLYRKMGEMTGGTMSAKLESVLVDGRGHAITVHSTHAERDGKSLDIREGLFFTLVDGKISDIDECTEDIEKEDAFWS